jgi:TonB family protein
MSTRFCPLFFSLILHGLLASFVLVPFIKLPEKNTFKVEVRWEKPFNNDISTPSLRALPAKAGNEAGRSNPVKNFVIADQVSPSKIKDNTLKTNLKLKIGLLRPPLRGARNDGMNLTLSVPPPMHKEQTEAATQKPYQPLPKYPWICRKRGQEGRVSLVVQTNEEGNVISVNLHESSGHALLDQSALSAVQTWIFPEASIQKILSFTFRLKGSEGEVS